MAEIDMKEKLVELIAQKVCDAWSEACDEWLPHDCGKCYANDCHIAEIADHLIAHGVTVQENTEISDELLEQLRNAPVTILQEEPTIEVVQEWISVKDRLPEKGTGNVLVVKQFRGKSYVDMGEVIGETACCYSDEYCINPREHIFTHWMPLPQPPKGE